MDYCTVVLFTLLFANGVSKGETSAREETTLPKKNPRDVETVVKMKYLQPITRLEKLDTIVPELQLTIREFNSDSNDLLDSDQSEDLSRYLPQIGQAETTEGNVYWKTWSSWDDCSASCGEGISSRTRTCISRSEIDLKCDGQSVEYKLCKVQECPEGSKDYRAKQCADHDDEIYFDQLFKWEPYSGPEGPTCELQCTPSNSSDDQAFHHSFGTVADGTKCGLQGVCINGDCRNIGCDGIIGSNRKKDQCGVCNGDNSTCVRRYNTVERLEDISPDYHELTKIPKGATNIVVKDYSRCYLALFEMEQDGSRTAVVNGDWVLNFNGEYKASGGTIARYSRHDETETIEVEGPTKTTLQLMILTTHRKEQPSVEFEYWIPHELSNSSKGAVSSSRRVLLPALDEDDYLNIIRSEGFNGDEVELPSLPTTTVTTTTTQASTTTSSTHTHIQDSTKVRPSVRLAQCNPYKRSGGKKKMFCDSDFAMYVRILPWRRIVNGRLIRYTVEVVRKYKTNVRLSRKEYIWLPISCRSKVRFHQHYLIMGRTKPRSTNGKIVRVSKLSNGQAIDRFPREHILLGTNVEMVRFYHKHHTKMSRLARRVKCRKNRRSLMKYPRRRYISPANVNKR